MIASKLIPFCLQMLATIVAAQSPPGFDPSVSQNLQVAYGANNISPAGKMIARPETASPPSITVPQCVTSATAKALLIMVDLDVPVGDQRITNLHWLAPNVDISNAKAVVPNTGNVVRYLQPSPPPGDTPHRYVYLLYAQPNNFTPPQQIADLQQNRLGFDVNDFAAAGGLGQPLAANFIMVQQ